MTTPGPVAGAEGLAEDERLTDEEIAQLRASVAGLALVPAFERIVAARTAALRAERDAALQLAKDAISAIGTGGHGHWNVGGRRGGCEACNAINEAHAALSARLPAALDGDPA